MEIVTRSTAGTNIAAVITLAGLACVWAALAVLVGGGSPAGLAVWVLLACGLAGSATGSLLSLKHSSGTVRWAGVVSFGLGVGVCVLALALLHQA